MISQAGKYRFGSDGTTCRQLNLNEEQELAMFSSRTMYSPRAVVALVLALAVSFSAMSTASAQEDMKVAYVDLQRALEESDEGQEIRSELEREFQQRQESLDEKQQEVMALREEIEQQSMMLSDEAMQEKQAEWQGKMEELQQTYLTLQQELAEQEAQATERLFGRMQGVVEEIGEEEGYTLILERSNVLYADGDEMDLTDELIERFNEN